MSARETTFEPKIVGFFCNWCAYRAADSAGSGRIACPPNLRIIRLMCSGRLDPSFVLHAFSRGADGVLIAGCRLGECHYLKQNQKTMRRVAMLRHLLSALGIEPERLRVWWASAVEGQELVEETARMVEILRALGPLDWPGQWPEQPGLPEAGGSDLEPIPLPVEPLR
jgi:F420-non-reducing hydrogenase iron-sulfur subunit